MCSINSSDAYRYFARDDDGQGMERGRLTYAIAYAPRHPNKDNGFRFTEAERDMLENEYGDWLRNDTSTLIFNYDFFNAEVGELQKLYDRLEASECTQ